jgi:hypothetical protein
MMRGTVVTFIIKLRQSIIRRIIVAEESALDGIEEMKNQLAMMMGQYTSPQQSPFPMTVNDDGSIKFVIHDVIGHDVKSKKKAVDQLYALVPQGLIRGGRPGVTDEIVKQAIEAFKKKK